MLIDHLFEHLSLPCAKNGFSCLSQQTMPYYYWDHGDPPRGESLA